MARNTLIRRIIVLVISFIMVLSLAACGDFTVMDDIEEGTIAWVAWINNCSISSLNMVKDEEGYVTFLGEKFTRDKITNAKEALGSISDIENIAGLEGLEFSYLREDVSPVTGFTYYSFAQVSSISDEDLDIQYSNSIVKIIVGEDGKAKGFSAQVNRDLGVDSDDVEIVAPSEAEIYVKSLISKDSNVYSKYTTLKYWEDEGTAIRVADSRVVPVWMVVTDEPYGNQPYTTFLVYAIRDYNLYIVDKLGSNQPTQVIDSDSYVSELFFSGMEDGGTYTYSLDMDWAEENDTGYSADNPLEVTVPVMYDPEQKLYYLADYENRIAVSNYYDFFKYNEVNPVVTKTPEDLDSWHFATEKSDDGDKYFTDPDYIVGTYWCMCNVYEGFEERYGEEFMEQITPPILLNVYYVEKYYPDSVSDFETNACSIGQKHDWNAFATSPSHSMCIEFGTLAHEFTHGINSQLASTNYYGETGAVMEGFADGVGEMLAYVCGFKEEQYKWLVGSEYSEIIRSMQDPCEYQYARYIGGNYYVKGVNSAFDKMTDNSGVHVNGGVLNYLTYCLCNQEVSEATPLEIDEILDMWLETIYSATYETGFQELGAYMIFVARGMEIDDEKASHVSDTLKILGFKGESEKLKEMVGAEEYIEYVANISYDDNLPDKYGSIMVMTDGEIEYSSEEPDENGQVKVRVGPQINENYAPYLVIADKTRGYITGAVCLEDFSGSEKNINVYYKEYKAGDTVSFEGKIGSYTYAEKDRELEIDDDVDPASWDLKGKSRTTLKNKGIYTFAVSSGDGEDIYMIMVE